jgi:hypothetical protein
MRSAAATKDAYKRPDLPTSDSDESLTGYIVTYDVHQTFGSLCHLVADMYIFVEVNPVDHRQ